MTVVLTTTTRIRFATSNDDDDGDDGDDGDDDDVTLMMVRYFVWSRDQKREINSSGVCVVCGVAPSHSHARPH